MAISAASAYFLKLGCGGDWAADSIVPGRARIGWIEVPLNVIRRGKWDAIRSTLQALADTSGAGTMDANPESGRSPCPFRHCPLATPAIRSGMGTCSTVGTHNTMANAPRGTTSIPKRRQAAPLISMLVLLLFGGCSRGGADLKAVAASDRQPGVAIVSGRDGARLYGRLQFRREAPPVWMVAESPNHETEDFDILYFDKNADGTISTSTEVFRGKELVYDGKLMAREFFIGQIEVKDVGTHESLTINVGSEGASYSLLWLGKTRVWGGVGTTSLDEYSRFTSDAALSPIFCADLRGPLDAQHWMSDELHRGERSLFRVAIGRAGVGTNTFSRVDDGLMAKGEFPLATLVCSDLSKATVLVKTPLTERCCGGLYSGSIDVPPTVAPGAAKVLVDVPAGRSAASRSETPVTIR